MSEDGGTRRGLSAARTRLIMLAGAVLAVVLIGGALLWNSGMVVSRLDLRHPQVEGYANGDTHEFSVRVSVANNGWAPLDVLDIGRDGPGLDLVHVAGAPLPYTLPPGESRDHELVYRVTDCAAVPATHWPIPVRLDRAWGEEVVYLDLPPVPARDVAEQGLDPGGEPVLLEWQYARTSEVCRRQAWSSGTAEQIASIAR
jgi:hypothetical protein